MSHPPADTHAPRLDSITGLRWWAAFVVFGYHLLIFAPLPEIAAGFLRFGYFGVTFFFVLSGFVLTWSMRAGTSIGTFYWRRFARIWPLSLVTLALAVPVFYSFAPDPDQWWVKPFSVGVLLLSVVLLQGWSRDPVILFSGNPAAWTLTVEVFFYALHPFIARVLRLLDKRGALIGACAVIVLSVLARITMVIWPTGWFAGLPWPILRLNEFVLGMCLAWAFRKGWRPRLPFWLPVTAIVVYFAGMVALGGVRTFAPLNIVVSPYTSEVVIVLCAALIVAAASRELRGRPGWIASRPLVALGEWSFAFYLIHATIIYTFVTFLGVQGPSWRNLGWAVLLLILSLVAAAILHHGVEKPVEKRLRRWQQAKINASTARKVGMRQLG